MASRKKSVAGIKRVLILRNGKTFEVVSENNRFWVCKGTQFRKGNPDVLRVAEKVAGEKNFDNKEED